jgi:hypothetical protein
MDYNQFVQLSHLQRSVIEHGVFTKPANVLTPFTVWTCDFSICALWYGALSNTINEFDWRFEISFHLVIFHNLFILLIIIISTVLASFPR